MDEEQGEGDFHWERYFYPGGRYAWHSDRSCQQ